MRADVPMSSPSKDKTTRIREDERQAFEQFIMTRSAESFCGLFKVFYPQIRRYFLVRGVDWMVAEELAQNAMFIVYRRIDDLREKELFCGWLFKIARNELLQHLRQDRRRNRIAEFKPLNEEILGSIHTDMNLSSMVRFQDWLAPLDQEERELVTLRFIDGLSYEELALALNLPLGTVKWRIFNARRKLAKTIDLGSAKVLT